jgi:hypothetical protein
VTEPVHDVDEYPYRTVGRLRLVRAGRPQFATACVVGANLVYTSAGNLWDDGAWSTEVSFELRYHGGDFVGPFSPRPGSVRVPDRWQAPGATTTFDWATFEAEPPLPDDEPLHPRSTLGLAWKGLTGMALGYGGPGGTDLERMYQSTGPVDYLFPFLGQLPSSLGEVARGGPWLVEEGGAWQMVGGTGRAVAEVGALVSPAFVPLVVPFLGSGPTLTPTPNP